MLAMPSTIVRKMTGVITIFTRFTNVSPTGFIFRATSGATMPSSNAGRNRDQHLEREIFVNRPHSVGHYRRDSVAAKPCYTGEKTQRHEEGEADNLGTE